jgi:hypothetical protein
MEIANLYGLTTAERLVAYEKMFAELYEMIESGLPITSKAVQYIGQSLTDTEKKQARDNIGAIDSSFTPSNASSANVIDNERNIVIGKTLTASQLVDGKIYMKCTISGTISQYGIFRFFACNGTIDITSSDFKIYAYCSPDLIINGITSNNWVNIFIDGVASFGQVTRFINGIQIIKNTEFNNSNAPSEKTVTFQVSFASNNYIIAVAPNIIDTDYKFYKAMPSVEHLSASQFKLKFVSFDGGSQVSPAVDYIAIGKWK